MTQQINLYQVEEGEVDRRITFNQVVMGVWGFLGLMLLMTTPNMYTLIKNSIGARGLEQAREAQQKELDAMSGEMEKQKENDKILEVLKTIEDKNKEKQALLDRLSASENTKIIGYSSYFQSLAKKVIDGLWVNKISIKNNGDYLFLSGASLSPELVTQFMAALSSEPAFTGKTFALFNMSLDEKTKNIVFNVETKKVDPVETKQGDP